MSLLEGGDRSKQVIFDLSGGRFGDVLGAVLRSKIDPKSRGRLTKIDLVIDLVVYWSQDGSKTVPRGLLGGSWATLGGSWALLGRS